MKKLKKDLKYQQQDLYSSLPTKRFTRKIKNKPLKSKETIEIEERRKDLLGAMQKAVQARDRNKYISSHKGNATDFLQHLGTKRNSRGPGLFGNNSIADAPGLKGSLTSRKSSLTAPL